MPKKDPRVDAYIRKARPFAKPILRHLRSVIHAACPDVVENLKWGAPSFEYKGLMCGFASFNTHATFGFWKHSLILKKQDDKWNDAMGSFGRLTSVKDLPPKARISAYVKRAMELNDAGVKAPHMVRRKPRKPLPVPADLKAALARKPKARTAFDALAPSHRREYIEWITEAKMPETRARRVTTAVSWMASGKSRNWKYEKR